jgi:putative ABC transport system permease protein
LIAELFNETLRSIRAHAGRFGLTSLGIVWGVAMLTYLSASMDGYDRHFARQMDKVGQRVVFMFAGIVSKRHVGQRGSRAVELELEDIERLRTLHTVERAAPNMWVGARMIRAGRRTKLAWTWAVSEDTATIRSFELAAGRMISKRDVDEAANVVFLGAKAAKRLFGRAPAVGRRVHIDSIPFRVVGVSEVKGEQIIYIGPADDEVALIPITTAQRWFTQSDLVHDFVFAPRTREESWDTVRYVRALLGLHNDFRHDDDTAMAYFNIQEAVDIVSKLLLGLRVFLSTASLVTLLVGAVGVMNIMLVVVTERTKEIGLRKAIGASNGAIFLQFLAETLFITIAAGLVGGFLGVLGVRLTSAAMGEGSRMAAKPVLEGGAFVLIFFTLSIVAVISGLLPAMRASRIDPALALRST